MPITLLLHQTENPENLGSIARAASNFDFHDILLLDPKCSIEAKSRWLAKHGQETLDAMKVIPAKDVEKTLLSFDTIVATQGRNSTAYNLVRAPITPRELRERIAELDIEKTNIGILFGAEGEGLSPEMLRKADIILSIPTSRDNPSMNLSQSIVIVLYELSLLNGRENKITLPYRPMNKNEHDALMQLVEKTLDSMEWKTAKQKETQQLIWRRMVGKSFLTKREGFAVMGYLKNVLHRKVVEKKK